MGIKMTRFNPGKYVKIIQKHVSYVIEVIFQWGILFSGVLPALQVGIKISGKIWMYVEVGGIHDWIDSTQMYNILHKKQTNTQTNKHLHLQHDKQKPRQKDQTQNAFILLLQQTLSPSLSPPNLAYSIYKTTATSVKPETIKQACLSKSALNWGKGQEGNGRGKTRQLQRQEIVVWDLIVVG